MTATFVPPVGAAAAADGALGVAAVLPVWAMALTPIPDASIQTSANERFMEIRNSFGSWGVVARISVRKQTFRFLAFPSEALREATFRANKPKRRAETRTEDILRNSSEL
jgi:hypothetical protein